MPGSSVSTFYRMRQRYEEEGLSGLLDRRLGKMSARRAPVDAVLKVVSLFETQYYDFTVKHFHQTLSGHGIHRSYTWTQKVLQTAGVLKKGAASWGSPAQAPTPADAGYDAAPGRFEA